MALLDKLEHFYRDGRLLDERTAVRPRRAHESESSWLHAVSPENGPRIQTQPADALFRFSDCEGDTVETSAVVSAGTLGSFGALCENHS